jgi:hypothetical protein
VVCRYTIALTAVCAPERAVKVRAAQPHTSEMVPRGTHAKLPVTTLIFDENDWPFVGGGARDSPQSLSR